MSSTRKFNWKGISENYDGSFNVEDKRARRRLLKELHGQGFKVRSKKIEGDGYQISPIGQGNFKAARKTSAPARSAARPRMAYTSYRRPSQRMRSAGPRLVAYPSRPTSFNRPYYGAPPRVGGMGGPGLLNKTGQWIKRRRQERMANAAKEQKERIEAKKTEQEINEKMKSERIAQERAETARQAEKQQFAEEAYKQKKHEEAERIRSRAGVKMDWQNKEIKQEMKEHPWADKKIAKQIAHDHAALEEARQDYVTGG